MVSYLSSSAHFFLMFPTVVLAIPKCRATEKEDLSLFNNRITSLFCAMARGFQLEEGGSSVDTVELYRLMYTLYIIQLMYRLKG